MTPNFHNLAHRLDVRGHAFRAGLGQVVRQQQDAVCARLLGRLRTLRSPSAWGRRRRR